VRQIETKDYVRPHPRPLPRGEGEASYNVWQCVYRNCSHRLSRVCFRTRSITSDFHDSNKQQMILPLLGERGGVRAELFN
jgi:hypothetical protein